jgi:GNAT superfamily N-acetyltransferase
MQVRPAAPEDAAAVEALYRSLVPNDTNINVQPRRLAELQDDASNRLFVAEDAGAVCGTVFVTICRDPMYGFASYGVVENVIVAESARGRGVGRALLAAVEQHARAARCTKLMLLSSVARVEAHAFFQHLGFDGAKKRGFVKYLNRPAPR